jgi:hypothetical protein
VSAVSHHMLRRRARNKASKLNKLGDGYHYRVEKAHRGPWRWRVVRSELGLRPE